MGPCQDVEVDLKQAGASCQNIAQSPPGCFFGCPVGMAMTGMYRTTTNNLLGITKFRCCQVFAIPLQVVTPVVSAPQGSAATMLLYPGQKLCSPTACAFYLTLQADCNAMLYKTGGSAVWSTSTQGSLAPCSLAMESKGSLVLYDRAKANKYSSSSIDSSSKGPFTLKVTDDGNLLIFDGTGAGYWSARPTLAPTGVPTSSPTAVPIVTVAPTAAPSVSAACATPPASGARAGGFSCVPPNCLQGPSYAAGANIYDLATAWKLCGITPGCGVVQAQSTSAGSRFTLRKGDETFNANAASTTSYSYPCAAQLPSVCSISNPPESERTYSTVWDNNARGTGWAQSMLNSNAAWVAREQAVGQWATISLLNVSSVGGVITQGRNTPAYLQYVSSFKVQASTDCVAFTDVDGGKVFTGNSDLNGQAQVRGGGS